MPVIRHRRNRCLAAAVASGIGAWWLALGLAAMGGERRVGPAGSEEGGGNEAAYEMHEFHGWTVRVSRELVSGDGALAAEALEVLEAKLGELVDCMPADRLPFLRTVPFVLEWKNRAFEGAVYHPVFEGPGLPGLSVEKAGCIELPSAAGFLRKVREQPMLLLHELAHAFHQQTVGFDEPSILEAYARAKGAGIYEKVERSGVHGPPVRAYALKNAKEYFAELTEAYFGRNDYFPFTRDDLAAHDPAGFAAVEAAWAGQGEKKAGPAAPLRD